MSNHELAQYSHRLYRQKRGAREAEYQEKKEREIEMARM